MVVALLLMLSSPADAFTFSHSCSSNWPLYVTGSRPSAATQAVLPACAPVGSLSRFQLSPICTSISHSRPREPLQYWFPAPISPRPHHILNSLFPTQMLSSYISKSNIGGIILRETNGIGWAKGHKETNGKATGKAPGPNRNYCWPSGPKRKFGKLDGWIVVLGSCWNNAKEENQIHWLKIKRLRKNRFFFISNYNCA